MGGAVARYTPRALADIASTAVGGTLSVGLRTRRELVARHLRRVDPSLEGRRLRRAVAEAFDSYARYYIESFRLPYMTRAEIDAGFDESGYEEHLLPALERGRGAIIALAHLGGWEWAGRWIAERGHPISVVVERLEPPEVFQWFVELRESLGMQVIPLGPDTASQVTKALRANHIVCLLCDRSIDGTGVEVEFFGETTVLPAGPAMLALRTGASVLPTAIYFSDRPDGHRAVVHAPLEIAREADLRSDVARIMRSIAIELEHIIRVAPTQWHLQQPNWPSDPGWRAGS
jgi:phosphatidylinositol dimannoside acyltransferase